MAAKGIAREFAERVFEQIKGFGEYGFPESHAASFALICYVTAWLRRHHLPEFTCSLLNAQPMGFYSPATIIEDARRRGVDFLQVDINASTWHCTMESGAVRMGFRYVKGLGDRERYGIESARRFGPFVSAEDLVERAHIRQPALEALATAGALLSLGVDRRTALWEILGRVPERDAALDLTSAESAPGFAPMTAFEEISWDFERMGHSAHGHPLSTLREQLVALRLPDARTVTRAADGRQVRYAGLVICRQRPGTAAGVLFMTLEDETGFVNLVVWPDVFERWHVLIKTTSFLGVTGVVQHQDGVVHVIAERFWVPEVSHRPVEVSSHDFR
jgi:error-prone DNA polymerase